MKVAFTFLFGIFIGVGLLTLKLWEIDKTFCIGVRHDQCSICGIAEYDKQGNQKAFWFGKK